MASRDPDDRGPASGPGSCGHGLQVALQLTHGGLIQGEEVKVKGGVGDIEVASLLDQVHDLEGGGKVASGDRKLGWGVPHPPADPQGRERRGGGGSLGMQQGVLAACRPYRHPCPRTEGRAGSVLVPAAARCALAGPSASGAAPPAHPCRPGGGRQALSRRPLPFQLPSLRKPIAAGNPGRRWV